MKGNKVMKLMPCAYRERTDRSDEHNHVDKNPVRDHGNRATHIAHALRVNLRRIAERNGQEGEALEQC